MRVPGKERLRRGLTPLFDRIVANSNAYAGLKSAQNEQAADLIDLTRPPTGPGGERLLEAAALLLPHDVPGVTLTRVGLVGDGGYVMADDLRADGALSLGVGHDVSWDADMARRGVPVAAFDPTVRRLPTAAPGVRFHRLGISDGSGPQPDYLPLADLVRVGGFRPDQQLLLKADVEGAEWGALASLADDDLLAFRQITIELHDFARFDDPAYAGTALAALRALDRHHLPIHLHANNAGRVVRVDGVWFPNLLEATYLRRDLAAGATRAGRIRSEHDAPNDPRVAEIDIEGLLRR